MMRPSLTITQPTRGFGVASNSALSASASACCMNHRSDVCCSTKLPASRLRRAFRVRRRGFALVLLRLDFADRIAEIRHVLEALVHRCEADVADLVELVQLAHHHLADRARRNL